MGKPEILLLESMMPQAEARLEADYQLYRLLDLTDPDSLLTHIGPRIRGIATGGRIGAPRRIIDALPALEIIAINGIGTDAVDLENARVRGIRVTTTPDVLTADVADIGMGLLLDAARGLSAGDRFVRADLWGKHAALPLGRKVTGKRLGILGLGRIGRAIARRAEGFDMAISYYDIRRFEDVPYPFVENLEQLAAAVDFLIVAASGGPQSRGIVNTAVLDALGPDGILVNVARGSVVDENALVAALQEKRIGGAGLDVFSDEPHVPPALLTMDTVVLQPHRASATVETRLAMADLVCANLAAQFAGQPPPTAVV